MAHQQISPGTGITMPAIGAVAGACDCHFHIYDPRFPYDEAATLRPPPSTCASYLSFRRRLGLSRGVVIQPTSFGTDNRPTLKAVQELGIDDTRAVVVVDDTFT